MNLLEYEAKAILKDAGVDVPLSELIAADTQTATTDLVLPVVIKSQVPIGGRGKLGGIKKVATEQELTDAIDTISTLNIKGYTPKRLLVEEALDVKHEYYVSLMINRALSCIELSAHRIGGVEIESQASDEFLRRSLDHRSIETAGELLAEYFG
jgi:succinyl-CoA synthetase beta subunit